LLLERYRVVQVLERLNKNLVAGEDLVDLGHFFSADFQVVALLEIEVINPHNAKISVYVIYESERACHYVLSLINKAVSKLDNSRPLTNLVLGLLVVRIYIKEAIRSYASHFLLELEKRFFSLMYQGKELNNVAS
jgi:hypothetical protein